MVVVAVGVVVVVAVGVAVAVGVGVGVAVVVVVAVGVAVVVVVGVAVAVVVVVAADMTTYPCAGARGCTIPEGQVVTFLGWMYCARHALPAVAEAMAMQRRLAGHDLLDALDILRGAIAGVHDRLRRMGIDSRPAEVERAS